MVGSSPTFEFISDAPRDRKWQRWIHSNAVMALALFFVVVVVIFSYYDSDEDEDDLFIVAVDLGFRLDFLLDFFFLFDFHFFVRVRVGCKSITGRDASPSFLSSPLPFFLFLSYLFIYLYFFYSFIYLFI